MLAPDQRTAKRDAAQAGEHEEMDERLSGGRDAHCLHASANLVTGQRSLLRQRTLNCRDPALGCAGRDAGLSEAADVACEERRRRQLVQSPVVLASDELQGAAVQPADHQRPLLGESAIDIGG